MKKTSQNAGNLTSNQLELLDEFVNAFEKLNESGVSLVYNKDTNTLHAVNRDMMEDCEMYDLENELPEGTLLVTETMTSAIEGVNILPVSKENDMYYYSKD